MHKKLLLSLVSCILFISAQAQPTARAQFVNNSPDVTMPGIDVYIDGNLSVNDLNFRSATAFLDVPAAAMATIGIAPATSTSSSDIFYTTTFNLQPHDTVVAIINGVKSTAGYNPVMPLRIDTLMGGRETAHDPLNVDVMIAHGVTDAPVIDIRTGIETIADNFTFGNIERYLELPMGNYKFRITNDIGSKTIETYSLALSSLALAGDAGILIMSGFMNPATNNNGALAMPMFVPASGGAFKVIMPTTPEAYARVQYIHNSADKSYDTVDVYLNTEKVADDVPFRTATGFMDADVTTALNMHIAPKNSSSSADAFHSQVVKFDSGKRYVLVIDGIKSPSGYSPAQPFAVRSFNGAKEEGTTTTNTDIVFLHSSTDFPKFDLREGNTVHVDDLIYGNFTSYISFPANANYIWTITDEAATTEFAKYKAELQASNLQGHALTMLLSGFMTPADNSNGAPYGLYYAKATGGPLTPLAVSTSVTDISKSQMTIWPNPASDKLYISAGNNIISITVYDATGKAIARRTGYVTDLNISKLVPGSYFLQVETKEHSEVLRFVKQ